MDLFNSLGFKVTDPTSGLPVWALSNSVADCKLLSKYPNLTVEDPSKKIKGWSHHPRLDQSVRSVVQAQRRIPLSLVKQVESELRRLEKEGTIEPIEASQWV